MLRQIALIKPPRFSRNGSWQNNKKRKKEMITAFLASDLVVIEKEGRWHRQWCIRPSSHSALGNGSRLVWEARKKCNQSFYILTWERENNCGRRRKPAYTLFDFGDDPGLSVRRHLGAGFRMGLSIPRRQHSTTSRPQSSSRDTKRRPSQRVGPVTILNQPVCVCRTKVFPAS